MIFKDNSPVSYLITEGKLTAENFASLKKQIITLTEIAVESKITLIQIREKVLPAKLIFELTQEIVEISQQTDTKILVNDRADIALAAGANGVHLTSKSISTKTIRANFPSDFIIGVSTHSLEKAKAHKAEGADFVTFSPVFPTSSKTDYGKPKGLEELQKVCDSLKSFPVIALGGIDFDNYKSVIETGAKGFASIGFLNNVRNLRKLNI